MLRRNMWSTHTKIWGYVCLLTLPSRVTAAPVSATPSLVEELSGYFFEDLEVGMTAVYARTIGPADLVMFAGFRVTPTPCI